MKNNYFNETVYNEDLVREHSEKMAALGQLAGGIAHDFNNHLMSIIGNATMIQKINDLDRVKEYADRIIHISQNAANLTKKILLFSKNESSIDKFVNMKNILDNTYNMMEFILSNEINLIYNYHAKEQVVLGDESQIESMIVNIILNSKDAMPNKFGTIKVGANDIEIFSEMILSHGDTIVPGRYIEIYVEDYGTGIDREILPKIFEPYFSTKFKTNGTGLGLSVVFGTVKLHGGYINVISKINKGTRFQIFIPLSRKSDFFTKRKVLEKENNLVMIVDDDPEVLNVEVDMLEEMGYEIVRFNNPIEALNYFKKESQKISFSLLDVRMPELGGKELFNEMQIIDENSVAIFITGYAQQNDYEELIKMGLTVIEKPFTYDILSKKIAEIYI